MKKTVSLVLIVFSVVSVLTALKDVSKTNTDLNFNYYRPIYENGTVSVIKKQIRNVTDEILSENGVEDYELTLETDIKDGELSVNRFSVVILDNAADTEKINSEIEKRIGFKAKISVEEKEQYE